MPMWLVPQHISIRRVAYLQQLPDDSRQPVLRTKVASFTLRIESSGEAQQEAHRVFDVRRVYPTLTVRARRLRVQVPPPLPSFGRCTAIWVLRPSRSGRHANSMTILATLLPSAAMLCGPS